MTARARPRFMIASGDEIAHATARRQFLLSTTERIDMPRRPLTLMLLAMVPSLSCIAAPPHWMQISSGANPGPVVFIDTNSIQVRAGHLSAWTMYNYADPQKTETQREYMSGIGLKIFDCSSARGGTISLSFYSEDSGQGDVVWSASREPGEVRLRYFAPGTLGDKVLHEVCQLAGPTAAAAPASRPNTASGIF